MIERMIVNLNYLSWSRKSISIIKKLGPILSKHMRHVFFIFNYKFIII